MKSLALCNLLKKVLIIPIVVASLALVGAATTRESHIYDFTHGKDGAFPWAGLTQDSSGTLYGTTNNGGNFLYGVVFKLTYTGGRWRETVLHNFGAPGDGLLPEGDLVLDRRGDIFGVASGGGTGRKCNPDPTYTCGIVFELSAMYGHRIETILHTFSGSDGSSPQAGLIFDDSGNLYGTTRYGGLHAGPYCPTGCGTIFKLTPTSAGWVETELYRFRSLLDGNDSVSAMVFDKSGNLFGTTQGGGNGNGCIQENGCGTVFELERLTSGWRERVLYRFSGLNGDGAYPLGGLNIDAQGNLFGTTNQAGASNAGTIFELIRTATGWRENILYTFRGGLDGSYPSGTLTSDGAGNFYGVTNSGGVSTCDAGCGTVFKLTRLPDGSWRHTVLYRFSSYLDGYTPVGRLIIGRNGHLLGTNFDGGTHNAGNVFEVVP